MALALLVVACGSSTVSRTIAFVERDGRTRFDAASLTVTKGDTLRLTVRNATKTLQDFSIEGFRVERTVRPDDKVTVELEADRSGTYLVRSNSDRSVAPVTIVVPR
jgi:hypothetical protein